MQQKQTRSKRIVWLTSVLILAIVACFAFVLHRHLSSRDMATSTRIVDLSQKQLCGPYSLHTAASMLGFQLELPGLVEACKPSPKGVSMATLKKVAAKLGLNPEGYRITWDELLDLQSPAILYVNPNHFVTVNPAKHGPDTPVDSIRIFDSDKTPQWWSREKLEKSWSGQTLVCSEAPMHKPLKGARIKFDCLIYDLGDVRVPLNKKIDLSLVFANVGDQTVKIGHIKTTCGCTKTSLTGQVIEPGQQGSIDVAVDLDKARGSFVYLVIVETNDKITPIVKVRITGRAFNIQLTSRKELVLNAVPRQAQISKRLLLRDPGDGSLKTTNVALVISPPSFADGNEPIHIEAILVPYDSNKHPLLRADGNDLVIEIDVIATESAPIGEFEALLEIMTKIPSNELVRIPVRGAVITDIVAKPAALFFSSAGTQSTSKTVAIESRIGRTLGLQDVTVPPNLPLKVEKQTEPGKPILLSVHCSHSGTTGSTITGDIVCSFADETVLRIPVIIHSQQPH